MGNCIKALVDKNSKHIPYRDSKLTRLLQGKSSLSRECLGCEFFLRFFASQSVVCAASTHNLQRVRSISCISFDSLVAFRRLLLLLCWLDSSFIHNPQQQNTDSLGGNTRTVMIASIGPAASNYEETIATLRYADRAKQITNAVSVNMDPKDAILREMQDEIVRLKASLDARKNGMSGSPLSPGMLDGSGQQHMSTMSELNQVEEKVIERIIEQDTGISAADLAQLQREQAALHQEIEAEKEKERLAMEQSRATVESTTLQYKEQLHDTEQQLSREEQEMLRIQKLIDDKQQALLSGGEQVSKAQQQQAELRRIEAELQQRRALQEKLVADLKAAEDNEYAVKSQYSANESELQRKTRALKRLWSRFQEKKTELDYVSKEFEGERTDLIETIRALDQRLKQKQALLDAFIPLRYTARIEQRARYDDFTDEWRIDAIEYSGCHIARELNDDPIGGGGGGADEIGGGAALDSYRADGQQGSAVKHATYTHVGMQNRGKKTHKSASASASLRNSPKKGTQQSLTAGQHFFNYQSKAK